MTDQPGSAPSGQPGTQPGAGTPTPAPWYGADAGDEIKGFVETKGWNGPGDAIKSYRNLEQMLGADKAGRGFVWPKDDADTEGWNGLYAKLGRPESADGYKLPVPEGASPEFSKAIAPVMHRLGLSTKQAEGLAAFVNQYETEQAAKYETERQAKVDSDLAAFKTELGAAYDKTVELAKRAAGSFGVKAEQFAGLEEVLGLKGTVELFAAIGAKIGEDTFVGGDPTKSGELSAAAAKQRFEQLKGDQAWMAKLMSGDRVAVEEKERLDANMLGMSLAEYRAAKGGKAA